MFQTKQHNTRSAFKATLYKEKNVPVDLTGCEVQFFMKSEDGKNIIDRTMQVGINGEVLLVFLSDEVATSGYFRAEIIVTYPDGRKEIFPNDGYIRILIHPSLGGAS